MKTTTQPGSANDRRGSLHPGSCIVDIHIHLWDSTQQLGPIVAQHLRDSAPEPWDRSDNAITIFEEAMQTVHYGVILGFESRHLGVSIDSSRVAEYVARDPGKYLGFAGIDPMAESCLDDLDEAIELGLVGVTLSPSGQNFHPCHTNAMRIYERCAESGLPIFIHPGTHLGSIVNLEYDQPHLWDEPARSFPDLRLVLGQVGHPWMDQALVMIGKHRHMYADLSHLTGQPWLLYNALVKAHQSGKTNKLLFGSDFPFTTPQEAIVAIYSINTLTHGTMLPTIPREQLRGIVEHDTLACLGIDKPVTEPNKAPSSNDGLQNQDPPVSADKIEDPGTPGAGAGSRHSDLIQVN